MFLSEMIHRMALKINQRKRVAIKSSEWFPLDVRAFKSNNEDCENSPTLKIAAQLKRPDCVAY